MKDETQRQAPVRRWSPDTAPKRRCHDVSGLGQETRAQQGFSSASIHPSSFILHPSQLLVSVRSVEEAEAALLGGAGLINVKEPTRGPLGRADDSTIAAVIQHVAGRTPVSAACGELATNSDSCFVPGLNYVKWGLAGWGNRPQWQETLFKMASQGDKETRRQGDKETRRQGDRVTGRQGDKVTGRQQDNARPDHLVTLSPCHLVTLSPCPVVVAYADWQRANVATCLRHMQIRPE